MSAAATAFIVEEFTPVVRSTLRGFARVRMPSGMIFHDVAIHAKGDAAWASPASKPMLDRNSVAVRDGEDKIRYVPLVTFASRELRDRFSEGVIEALRQSHPAALS